MGNPEGEPAEIPSEYFEEFRTLTYELLSIELDPHERGIVYRAGYDLGYSLVEVSVWPDPDATDATVVIHEPVGEADGRIGTIVQHYRLDLTGHEVRYSQAMARDTEVEQILARPDFSTPGLHHERVDPRQFDELLEILRSIRPEFHQAFFDSD